jgi:phage terminase large subunit-like protein
MTIYNKYFDTNTRADGWQRHVISDVFWDSNRGTSYFKGLTRTDRGAIYIPFYLNDMRNFVDTLEFQASRTGKWTIQNGDIIVKGTVTDEITKQSELEKKYSDVLTISNYTINDFGSSNMQHILIVGE